MSATSLVVQALFMGLAILVESPFRVATLTFCESLCEALNAMPAHTCRHGCARPQRARN